MAGIDVGGARPAKKAVGSVRRPKRRIGIKIDMTPMVDIAFLLLIFYMATTTFKPPEKKQVIVPRSHSEIKVPGKNMFSITLTKEDSVFVEYITKETKIIEGEEKEMPARVYEEASLETLASTITRLRVTVPGAHLWSIVIKADKNVSYGTIASVMDALQSLKINQFHLVTEMEMERQVEG